MILEKFKEKKQNVVTALREAIDAVYLTVKHIVFVLKSVILYYTLFIDKS